MSSENGHQPPPGVTWRQVLDVIVQSEDHHVFVTALAKAVESHGSSCLFDEAVQQRCAVLRHKASALYQGDVLELASAALPQRWRDWDRAITYLTMALEELDIVALSKIPREEIDWLWYPYIPLKKLTMMEGDPASGKTYLLLAIAAAITRGYALPDQDGRVAPAEATRAANVLYITAEDGLGDTLRPRAEKLGADLDRLFVPTTPQSFALASPDALRNAMRRFTPKLLVLDPLQAFLGAEMDMHRVNEVRPIMTTLLALAIEHECAVVMVRHWTKAPGGKARHRGQGSADFGAAARSQLSVGESPEDDRLRIMAQAKISLAALGTSIVFTITDEGLQWCGTSTLSADELSAAQPKRHQEQRKDAMRWLKDYLKEGEQPAMMVIHDAEKAGIPEKTLRRAKEHLHILSTKDEKIWFWRLPTFHKWDRERYPGQEEDD